MHAFPRQSREAQSFPAGDIVALRRRRIDVVISSVRCRCFVASIFHELDIEPGQKRPLVVRSAQHFHDALAPIAGEVIYMTAPAALSPDLRKTFHRRLYPWAEDPLKE
jgi:microcystin degradation protein MlrC